MLQYLHTYATKHHAYVLPSYSVSCFHTNFHLSSLLLSLCQLHAVLSPSSLLMCLLLSASHSAMCIFTVTFSLPLFANLFLTPSNFVCNLVLRVLPVSMCIHVCRTVLLRQPFLNICLCSIVINQTFYVFSVTQITMCTLYHVCMHVYTMKGLVMYMVRFF